MIKPSTYQTLRWNVFVNELKLLNEQIKHFSLLLFLFLWSSIPALIYLGVLGIGMVFDNKLPALQVLAVIWFFILFQTVLLLALQRAISGDRYTLFYGMLNISQSRAKICSAGLAVLCQPFLLISMFIMLLVPVNKWHQVSHAWLFILLQLTLVFVFLKHPKSIVYYAFCTLGYLALFEFIETVDIELWAHMLIWLAIAGLFLSIRPSIKGTMSLHMGYVPIEIRFWGKYLSDCRNLVTVQIGFLLIVGWLVSIAISEMPRHSDYVVFVGTQLIILVGASIPFSASRLVAEHSLFFAEMFCHSRKFRAWYLLSSIISMTLPVLAFLLFFGYLKVLPVSFAAIVALVYVISSHPKLFAITWFLLSAFSALISFYTL